MSEKASGSGGVTGAAQGRLLEDKRVDLIMGMLLRTGVLLSAAIVVTGGALFLLRHPEPVSNYRIFQGEPQQYRTLRGIFQDAFTGHGRGLIQLGLLLLIATPVARVIFSIGAFLYERDWTYVAVSLLVLSILLYSLFSGHS